MNDKALTITKQMLDCDILIGGVKHNCCAQTFRIISQICSKGM